MSRPSGSPRQSSFPEPVARGIAPGDFPSAPQQRLLSLLMAGSKHLPRWHAKTRAQAIKQLLLRFQAAVRENVVHRNALSGERRRHQHRPVAVRRIPLRAEKSKAGGGRLVQHPPDSPEEGVRCRQPGKRHSAFPVVTGGIRGPRSERRSEKEVADPVFAERALKGPAIELRMAAAIGNGTDIRHDGDPVPPQEGGQVSDRMVGVSDGENLAGSFHGAVRIKDATRGIRSRRNTSRARPRTIIGSAMSSLRLEGM